MSIGNFLLLAGRLGDALRVYEALEADAPEDSRPLFGAADVYKRRGAFARAAEAHRKGYELEGVEDAALAFTNVTTEAEFAKADMTVARDSPSCGHASADGYH